MKLLILMLINLIAYATASQEISIKASIKEIKPTDNKWLKITVSSEKTVEKTEVKKEIDMNEGLTIEYKVTNKEGDVFAEGGGPFCSAPPTKEGAIVKLLGKFLGVNLECNVKEKEGDKPEAEQFGNVILDEDPGQEKLYIDISITKNDVAIVEATLRGKGT